MSSCSTGKNAAQRTEKDAVKLKDADSSELSSQPIPARKNGRFWAVIGGVLLSTFFAVLEAYCVSTALPVIVSDLHSDQFVWVASAYAIASTALLPLSGGLADMFGRKPVILGSVLVFAFGGALAGAAQSMNMLIAARVLQGVGAGGMTTLSQITISDLVTLQERGTFNGLIGLTWSLSGCLGPLVGGSLARQTQWRWMFYLNIPACGLVAVLFLLFFSPNKPPSLTRKEMVARLDIIGNTLLVGSTCSVVIGLTWAGIDFPWVSAQVLAPLCIGVSGLIAFLVYEWCFCEYPIVPLSVLSNRTSLSGYVQIALSAFVNIVLLYYLPIFYQACKDASPIASGVDIFGLVFSTGPFSIIAGASIAKYKRYRPPLWIAWGIMLVGIGLISSITESTSRIATICYQIPAGAGIGMVFAASYFPVLAPLPTKMNAAALSFFVFIRTFAQACNFSRSLSLIWGVTIGGAILQNELQMRLPQAIQDSLPGINNIAYAIVPLIPSLEEPEKDIVRKAFAQSLVTLWRMIIAVGGVGLLASLPMRGFPLHTQTDEGYALQVQPEVDGSRENQAERSFCSTS
ncbi:Mfs1.2 [Lentinus brumalis]|uniref:Mfs1.2 n=1 Tax=Lentinus brumalis TaxID=2498619 RepID=A0A371DFN0_9APHY|nr:Mfs1.2 [Polyporus brumalis]